MSAGRLLLHEVPLPSSRTLRVMGTLTAAGHRVDVVHHPRHADRVRATGLGGVPLAAPPPPGLPAVVTQRLRSAEAAGDERALALWTAVRDHPVPPTTPRPGDVDVLVHGWLAAAETMSQEVAHLYWAADLDALPAVVWAARSRPGSRVVLDAHELFPHLDYLDPLQRPEWDLIARELVPEVDLLLTVGEEMAQVWRADYGARDVVVVPNLAPLPVAEVGAPGLRDACGLGPDVPLAVHVGNVVPNRRPELAVDLLERRPELHVAFVGEVRYGQDEMLRDTAAARGVTERLHLVDPVPTARLEPFVADADVALILYSGARSRHLEVTMPNKLYDALAAGLPVVATAGTAPGRHLERERLGVTFADGDPDALAAAVQTVLDDRELARRVTAVRDSARWPATEDRLREAVDRVLSTVRLPEGDRPARVLDAAAADGPGTPGGVAGLRRRVMRSPRTMRARADLGRRLERLAHRVAGR